jgi:hypothetical protein
MENKLGLDDREYAFFTAQIIACGDLHLLKVDKERALELLKKFFEAFVPQNIEPEVYVNSIYNIVQNSLLAHRGYSFEVLQLIPAFSEFGRKNLAQLLKFYREKGVEAFENGFKRMFRDGWRQKKPAPEVVRILSGDGKTIETPVRFSTGDRARRMRAEYWFITYNFGKERTGWERGVHYSVIRPEKNELVSKWSIMLADGRTEYIYFDADNG